MLHHLREMLHRIPAPRRYGRVMALLLASLGGAVDVFSHIHYEALVATQTGNFILLIADLHRDAPHVVHLRWLSVILFSFGYLAGHFIHDLLGQRARMRHWRIGTLLPFLLVCFAVPFMDRTLSNSFQVGALAFTVGLMIHALADTRIGENPFSLFMTSGNWRKMLSAWYAAGSLYLTRKTPEGVTKNEAKAQRRKALLKAIDYSLVVISFIAGVILMALVTRWFGVFSIWLAALIAGTAFCFGYQAEKKELREDQGA
ncbi:MAG: DUF1275 domain-containing protein [Rothia sp.]|uniref:YoaK family protein n=1 Tax=Rothia sp. (in: high G+C Gram-positive bacteria) TaxID=1885016 RepID=UPI001CB073E6|nr:YoaK family protein [Rothia sp. (in: high G+C Gram-positive bacteria)]MBF1681031.1 DUF1275 domain-containing protein [Rothia sp. (in: high G+C Gram-positive bacteria)]